MLSSIYLQVLHLAIRRKGSEPAAAWVSPCSPRKRYLNLDITESGFFEDKECL